MPFLPSFRAIFSSFTLSFNALLTVMEFLGIEITVNAFNTMTVELCGARLKISFVIVFYVIIQLKMCASITRMPALSLQFRRRYFNAIIYAMLQIVLNYEFRPFLAFRLRAIIIISVLGNILFFFFSVPVPLCRINIIRTNTRFYHDFIERIVCVFCTIDRSQNRN